VRREARFRSFKAPLRGAFLFYVGPVVRAAPSWVLGRFAEAERRDRQPVLRRCPNCVNRGLGAVEVFSCLGPLKQELKEAFQVTFGCR
jgi:hypothetical protein